MRPSTTPPGPRRPSAAWPHGAATLSPVTDLDDDEFQRWFATATEHLEAARHNAEGGMHNWACVVAEQAAQAALTALLHAVGAGERARGHDLMALAEASDANAGTELMDQFGPSLRRLYRHYQPARYPDALPGSATPHQVYAHDDADQALEDAEAVVVAVGEVRQRLAAELAGADEADAGGGSEEEAAEECGDAS